jgi:hypothetical protein
MITQTKLLEHTDCISMRLQLAHENWTIYIAKLDHPCHQICQKTYNHGPGRDLVMVGAFRVVVCSARLLTQCCPTLQIYAPCCVG